MLATHVTHILHSAHTATGIIIWDATDNSEPKPLPDLRPVVTKYIHASSGKILYTRVSGIGRTETWADASGRDLEWSEIPVIEPIAKIYREWGGAEYAQIV